MKSAADIQTPLRERSESHGDHAGGRFPQQRRPGRFCVGFLGLTLPILLTGCIGTVAAPTPPPTHTALIAGLFATEEEALDAAKERFLKYYSISDAATDEQSFNLIRPYVTDNQWADEYASTMAFFAGGYRTIGTAVMTNFTLIQETPEKLTLAFCTDISGANIYDAQGKDVTPSGRQLLTSMEVDMVVSKGQLLVDDWRPSEVKSCGE